MTIQAIYENGVFRPLEPVALPEKCRVAIAEIKLVGTPAAASPTHPLLELLEIAHQFPENPDMPTDFAEQHDHYLYGTPKRP